MTMVNTVIAALVLLLLALNQTQSFQLQTDAVELINEKDYHELMGIHPLAVEFAKHYGNLTAKDLNLRLPNQEDLKCLSDMALLLNGLKSGQLWALKMFDSWGSIPSGILYGNFIDMGSYDECLSINKYITDNSKVQGKYCFAKISNLKMAVCFPTSCTAKHMDTFLAKFLNKVLNGNITKDIVSEETCQTTDKEPLNGLAIFTIVVLSVLVAAVFLATICDYFVCKDQGKLPLLIKAFSARVNSRALFRLVEPETNPNVIDSLNGMRCMSLIWVLFGHQYLVSIFSPKMNYLSAVKWMQSPFASLILHGFYSVDTFLFLSGLLLVMIALRTLEKTKGKLNVPLMYLHRYLRLTPILALAIIMYLSLLPLIGDGPVADKVRFDSFKDCETNWFLTLLYVQNYATPNMCLSHSWYLAVDMQLYLLSPIFLIALYKWGKKAAAGIFVLMLLLSACLFSTMMTGKYSFYLNKGGPGGEAQRKIYFATHRHAAPWLIGVLCGYFLHLNRNKSFKLNPISIWLGWIVSLALIFTSLFALYPATQSSAAPITLLEESLYYTLTRIGWPLSLCWVVFACVHGYGGLANSFLSSPLWQPLSKLSYSAYIFHIFIQIINDKRQRSTMFFSDYEMMLSFWGTLGFTLLMSYLMYIIMEAPFGTLEGALMPKGKSKPKTVIKKEPEFEEPAKVEEATIASNPQS